jgi:hypothetical protein
MEKKSWAPRRFAAAALLPVSAAGLGLPRPYAAARRVRAAPRSSAASSPAWRADIGNIAAVILCGEEMNRFFSFC